MSTEDLKQENEDTVENDILEDNLSEEESEVQTEAVEEVAEETPEEAAQTVESEAQTETIEKVPAAEETDSDTEEAAPAAEKKGGFSAKKLILIIVAVLAVAALVICGIFFVKPNKTQGETITEKTTKVITGEEATEQAQVKQVDAIELIQSLSDKELGLKKEKYSFMVAQQAYAIGEMKYVQVIAAEKVENEDGSFQIIPHGKYYISFDGNTILRENMKNAGEYTKIK